MRLARLSTRKDYKTHIIEKGKFLCGREPEYYFLVPIIYGITRQQKCSQCIKAWSKRFDK